VGKSTVAKLLAKRLGVMYLDTGATYRALAYAAVVKARLNPMTDRSRVAAIARRLPLQLQPTRDGGLRVRLNGADITKEIRTEEVSEAAAQVSQYPEVRMAMVALQRQLARRPWTDPNGVSRQGVVVEGRDTGSVVFPAAGHKFFLDADPDVRARRRQDELQRLYGSRPPLAQIRQQIHFRDNLDLTRKVGPLVKPARAIAVDTTHRTPYQVVQLMLAHVRGLGHRAAARR
jgi:cytidylate kinase